MTRRCFAEQGADDRGGATASHGDDGVNDIDASMRLVNSLGVPVPPKWSTLEDDDTRGVTVSLEDLELDEGDDGAYTLVLTRSRLQVVVTSRSSGDADITVSGALTFSAQTGPRADGDGEFGRGHGCRG